MQMLLQMPLLCPPPPRLTVAKHIWHPGNFAQKRGPDNGMSGLRGTKRVVKTGEHTLGDKPRRAKDEIPSFVTHISTCDSLAQRIRAESRKFNEMEREIDNAKYRLATGQAGNGNDDEEWDMCSTWSDVTSESESIEKTYALKQNLAESLSHDRSVSDLHASSSQYISMHPPSHFSLTVPDTATARLSALNDLFAARAQREVDRASFTQKRKQGQLDEAKRVRSSYSQVLGGVQSRTIWIKTRKLGTESARRYMLKDGGHILLFTKRRVHRLRFPWRFQKSYDVWAEERGWEGGPRGGGSMFSFESSATDLANYETITEGRYGECRRPLTFSFTSWATTNANHEMESRFRGRGEASRYSFETEGMERGREVARRSGGASPIRWRKVQWGSRRDTRRRESRWSFVSEQTEFARQVMRRPLSPLSFVVGALEAVKTELEERRGRSLYKDEYEESEPDLSPQTKSRAQLEYEEGMMGESMESEDRYRSLGHGYGYYEESVGQQEEEEEEVVEYGSDWEGPEFVDGWFAGQIDPPPDDDEWDTVSDNDCSQNEAEPFTMGKAVAVSIQAVSGRPTIVNLKAPRKNLMTGGSTTGARPSGATDMREGANSPEVARPLETFLPASFESLGTFSELTMNLSTPCKPHLPAHAQKATTMLTPPDSIGRSRH